MVSPTLPAQRTGNGITAARWTQRLREIGCAVRVTRRYEGQDCDAMIALHARKSAPSARAFHALHPDRALIVALTGTDLYGNLRRSGPAYAALETAHRIILLQPRGRERLAPVLRAKARVILQSAVALKARSRPQAGRFDVAIIGHLRAVKDPFRAALAARRLPDASRLHVVHAGRALTRRYQERALHEMRINPRYTWYGDRSHHQSLRLLARCRALVLSSRVEGGANVISEAAVHGVPVLASRIPGSVGLLGPDYPGFFEVGDTRGLAALLHRIETQPRFAAALRARMRRLAPRFHPARERTAWARLLAESVLD